MYLGVCEDNTAGFRVVTPSITHTQYKLNTAYSGSPSLPAMSGWKMFGIVDAKEKSFIVPELCDWSGGKDYRYAQIEIKAEKDGVYPESTVVDALILKYSFVVNSTPSGSGILLKLNRNGTCFGKLSSLDSYTPLNVVPATSVLFNTSVVNATATSPIRYWLCNSTYGEVKTGSSGGGGMWFVGAVFWLLVNFIIGIVLSIFGIENFVWQSWYTLLVIFGLMIIVPLLYLILRDRGRRG